MRVTRELVHYDIEVSVEALYAAASCSVEIIGFSFSERKFRIVGGDTKFAYAARNPQDLC